MDNFQGAGSARQQPTPESSAYSNAFYNDMQAYANFNSNDDPNYDLLNDQFAQADPTPNFPQQSNSTWSSDFQAPSDSQIPQYDPLPHQQADHNRYGQSMFDSRPQSQPHFDQSLFPRPSQSPVQYNPYVYHHPVAFTNTPNFQAPPEYHQPQVQQQPQRRSPMPATSYSPDPSNHQYLTSYPIRPTIHQNLQGMHIGNFGTFPENHSRQPTGSIDPSLLDFQKPQFDQMQISYQQPQQTFPQATTPVAGQIGPSSAGRTQPMMVVPGRSGQAQDENLAQIPQENIPAKTKAKKDPNAPKRPRGRPRKDGTNARSGSGGSATDDSGSDDLEIEEAPEPVPRILQEPPPTLASDRIVYNTVAAVWSPRNKTVDAKKVSEAMSAFGDLLKHLRDQWKLKNEHHKKAELENTALVSSLKEEVTQLRKQAELVLENARDYGHPFLLAQLGNNPFTLSALQSFTVDRINASDNDGPLVRAILKLMVLFTSTDVEMLAKTKIDKILLRLTKRAGPEVQKLCQSILDHAAEASKKKAKASSPKLEDSPIDAAALKKNSVAGFGDRKVDQLSGTKRPGDQANLPAPKRTIQASKPLALQRKTSVVKNPAPSTNGTNSASAKPKAAAPVPNNKASTSIFSALSSASKKPGTSNAARAAAQKEQAAKAATQPKKESPPGSPPARVAAGPKPAFSFADTMAALDKPKEVKVKKVESRPPETEEEKAKRLRKELRRKLRVSWKSDDELTEVKIFHHHPDEEIGHSVNMMRDVSDVGGEGRMLKMHKDFTDDDEEEESRAEGEEIEHYFTPTTVDYDFSAQDTKDNYAPRGGPKPVDSPESEAQNSREETTLMVVYTSPADIPPSPKEPPSPADDEDDDYNPPQAFGEPDEKTRTREEKYYASIAPRPNPPISSQPDLSSLFKSLSGQNTNQFQQQQPTAQNQFAGLEAIFKANSHQQQHPQPNQPDASLIALVEQFKQRPQQPQQQQPQAPPSQQPQPQPYQTPTPAAAAAATPAQPSTNLAEMLANLKQLQAQSPSGQPTPGQSSSGRQYENGAPTAAPNPNPFPGRQVPNFKTVVCRFWKEGKCRKGDDCTYRHDEGM
ncbi:MAG: hypothetical protein Q9227_001362 [Pyrenula ochraceoflavens]